MRRPPFLHHWLYASSGLRKAITGSICPSLLAMRAHDIGNDALSSSLGTEAHIYTMNNSRTGKVRQSGKESPQGHRLTDKLFETHLKARSGSDTLPSPELPGVMSASLDLEATRRFSLVNVKLRGTTKNRVRLNTLPVE